MPATTVSVFNIKIEPETEMIASVYLEEPSIPDALIEPEKERTLFEFFSEADANEPKFSVSDEFKLKNEIELNEFKIHIKDIEVEDPSMILDDTEQLSAPTNHATSITLEEEIHHPEVLDWSLKPSDNNGTSMEALAQFNETSDNTDNVSFISQPLKSQLPAAKNACEQNSNGKLSQSCEIFSGSDGDGYQFFAFPLLNSGNEWRSGLLKEPNDSVVAQKLNNSIRQKFSNLGQSTVGKLSADLNKCESSFELSSKKSSVNHPFHSDNPGSSKHIDQFFCEKCCVGFEFKAYLLVHNLYHHCNILEQIKCPFCQREFQDRRGMTQHISLHTNEKFFKCKKCSYACRRTDHLKSHIFKHHTQGRRPYKCDDCDASYYNSHELKIHTRTHTGERPFKCKICECTFIRAAALTVHQRVHTKVSLHECKLCRSKFRTEERLQSHTEKRHPGIPDLIKCTLSSCLKVFPHKILMRKHFKVCHANPNSYSCAHCSSTYKQKASLIVHLRRHGFNKQRIKCAKCKKQYASVNSLDLHYATQHREKRYVCEHCGSAFARIDYFRVHSLKHLDSGGRPFVCAHCGADFYMKHHLKNHINIHMRNK